MRPTIKFTVVTCLAALLLVSGCAPDAKKPALKAMNIGMSEWVGYGPFYLGKEKGIFEEEGVHLDIIIEELDSARRDAFKAGMLDSEAGAINLLVAKRASDTPIVAVCALDYSCGADGIVASDGMATIEDLLGKRIVLARDDAGEAFLSYIFYKRGLPIEKIRIIPASPEKVSEVFLAGDADAVVTWEPELSRALARPGSRLIASSKEFPDIIIDTLDVREDIVKSDPGLVKALMRGWFRSVEYYMAHPVESSGIIAKYFRITPEEYRESVKGLRWPDYASQKDPAMQQQWKETFDIMASIALANGRITKRPDSRLSINTALLEELYR